MQRFRDHVGGKMGTRTDGTRGARDCRVDNDRPNLEKLHTACGLNETLEK